MARLLRFFFIVFFISAARAQGLSERDALARALANSPDVRVVKLELQKSAVDLQAAKGNALLQASVEAQASYNRDMTGYPQLPGTGDTVPSTTAGATAYLSQAFPGGGSVSLQAEETAVKANDSTVYLTRPDIQVRQPLMKGAWANSPLHYQIFLKQKEYAVEREQFLDNLADELSRIREAYWNWAAALALAGIRANEMDYAEKEMAYQRARFSIGQISAFDTLSACIELVKVKGALADAERQERLLRRQVATALGDSSGLGGAGQTEIPLGSIGTMERVLTAAESGNGALRILGITKQSLERQEKYYRNQRYPGLDLVAGYTVDNTGDAFFGSNLVKKNNATIGLVLSFDLFSRAGKAEQKKAKLDLEINRQKSDKAKRDLYSMVAGMFDSWKSDSLRYSLQLLEVELAEKRYQAMLQEEQLGTIDPLSRIKIKNDLIGAQIQRLDMAVSLKKIEIAVDQSTREIFGKFGIEISAIETAQEK